MGFLSSRESRRAFWYEAKAQARDTRDAAAVRPRRKQEMQLRHNKYVSTWLKPVTSLWV